CLLFLFLFSFFFYCFFLHCVLHSFPTRRSSDLFFELSSNNALKNDYISGYTPFTALSLFFNVLDVIALLVILLCSLTLIEVYEGFIEKNLKENSIFRACGYSSIRLSLLYCFLFIILCILIIPFAF